MKTLKNKIAGFTATAKKMFWIQKRNFVCKAPFNTLFFSMTGEVFLCLKNHEQVVGTYPQNSVKEILESKKLQQFRLDFKAQNGLHGCEHCQEQIKLKNYDNAFNQYSNYTVRKDKITVMDFELSNRCNLQCIMCSEHYSSMFKTHENKDNSPYDDSFVEQITPYLNDLKKAYFRGGEPFLIPVYYKLWDKLLEQNKNVRIGITTNATILTPKIEEYLKSRQFYISLSIDTLVKETFNKIRVNGDFEQYIANIERFIHLSDIGVCKLNVCTCIMTINRFEIPSIFRYCNKHNLAVHINYVEQPHELSLQSLSENEMNDTLTFLTHQKIPFSLNSDVFKSMLSILNNWKKLPPRIIKEEDKIDFINAIQPAVFETSFFLKQKEIFYDKLLNHLTKEDYIYISNLFVEIEKHNLQDNRILYLYLLLNHLPTEFIINSINNFSEKELEEQSEKLIGISISKFKING